MSFAQAKYSVIDVKQGIIHLKTVKGLSLRDLILKEIVNYTDLYLKHSESVSTSEITQYHLDVLHIEAAKHDSL